MNDAPKPGRAVSLLHIIDGSQARFDHWSFDEFRVGTTWADVTPVPEPSTYALLAGCGVIAFTIARRRKKQQS